MFVRRRSKKQPVMPATHVKRRETGTRLDCGYFRGRDQDNLAALEALRPDTSRIGLLAEAVELLLERTVAEAKMLAALDAAADANEPEAP